MYRINNSQPQTKMRIHNTQLLELQQTLITLFWFSIVSVWSTILFRTMLLLLETLHKWLKTIHISLFHVQVHLPSLRLLSSQILFYYMFLFTNIVITKTPYICFNQHIVTKKFSVAFYALSKHQYYTIFYKIYIRRYVIVHDVTSVTRTVHILLHVQVIY